MNHVYSWKLLAMCWPGCLFSTIKKQSNAMSKAKTLTSLQKNGANEPQRRRRQPLPTIVHEFWTNEKQREKQKQILNGTVNDVDYTEKQRASERTDWTKKTVYRIYVSVQKRVARNRLSVIVVTIVYVLVVWIYWRNEKKKHWMTE